MGRSRSDFCLVFSIDISYCCPHLSDVVCSCPLSFEVIQHYQPPFFTISLLFVVVGFCPLPSTKSRSSLQGTTNPQVSTTSSLPRATTSHHELRLCLMHPSAYCSRATFCSPKHHRTTSIVVTGSSSLCYDP